MVSISVGFISSIQQIKCADSFYFRMADLYQRDLANAISSLNVKIVLLDYYLENTMVKRRRKRKPPEIIPWLKRLKISSLNAAKIFPSGSYFISQAKPKLSDLSERSVDVHGQNCSAHFHLFELDDGKSIEFVESANDFLSGSNEVQGMLERKNVVGRLDREEQSGP